MIMQKGVVFIEIYKENNKPCTNISENVTIYDSGDSFVEYFHNTNEWKYWKVLDSSYNNGMYARIIQFIDYDIVPTTIISSYTMQYSDNIRGKWAIIRAEQVPLHEAQLPPPSSWIYRKTPQSSAKNTLHKQPPKSHRKHGESQEQQQVSREHPLKKPQSQQYLQQQSLQQQLLLLQQLQSQLSQQLLPVKKLPPLLSEPPSPPKQASLVPLVQPGSHSLSFPLVTSVLLPAR